MIRFTHRPDPVFHQLLNRLFDDAENECYAAMFDEKAELYLLQPSLIDLFGGPELLREILSRLRRAHDSKEVWMVSDYFFLLLDRLLKRWIARYNRLAKHASFDVLKVPGGRRLRRIDFRALFDDYFWDDDFDLPFDTATALMRIPNHQGGILDFSNDALNASRWIPPDTSDLWIKKMKPPELWEENPDWYFTPAQVRRLIRENDPDLV